LCRKPLYFLPTSRARSEALTSYWRRAGAANCKPISVSTWALRITCQAAQLLNSYSRDWIFLQTVPSTSTVFLFLIWLIQNHPPCLSVSIFL
jgi:hypothetical protein